MVVNAPETNSESLEEAKENKQTDKTRALTRPTAEPPLVFQIHLLSTAQ